MGRSASCDRCHDAAADEEGAETGVTEDQGGQLSGPHLVVTLAGRREPGRIDITDGTPVRDELARFLNRQGPYAQMWIKLASGEYVRYDLIESVQPSVSDTSKGV